MLLLVFVLLFSVGDHKDLDRIRLGRPGSGGLRSGSGGSGGVDSSSSTEPSERLDGDDDGDKINTEVGEWRTPSPSPVLALLLFFLLEEQRRVIAGRQQLVEFICLLDDMSIQNK